MSVSGSRTGGRGHPDNGSWSVARAEAKLDRGRQAGIRDQAQINREVAAVKRELARGERDQEAGPDRANRASEGQAD
jgi:hypothetical protein